MEVQNGLDKELKLAFSSNGLKKKLIWMQLFRSFIHLLFYWMTSSKRLD